MESAEGIVKTQLSPTTEIRTVASKIKGAVGLLDSLSANSIRESLLSPKLGANLEKAFYRHIASLYFLDRAVYFSAVLASFIPGIEQKVDEKYKDEFEVGKHLVVVPMVYKDDQRVHLSDGTEISKFQRLGEMHFCRDLPQLTDKDNLVNFTKLLYREANISLQELALMCQNNDPRVKNITFFFGESHIAGPLAKRLGFDIHEISNPISKLMSYYKGKWLVNDLASKNPTWQIWKKNFKPPQRAYISRTKLVEFFGEKPIQPTKTGLRQSIFDRLRFLRKS